MSCPLPVPVSHSPSVERVIRLTSVICHTVASNHLWPVFVVCTFPPGGARPACPGLLMLLERPRLKSWQHGLSGSALSLLSLTFKTYLILDKWIKLYFWTYKADDYFQILPICESLLQVTHSGSSGVREILKLDPVCAATEMTSAAELERRTLLAALQYLLFPLSLWAKPRWFCSGQQDAWLKAVLKLEIAVWYSSC